MPLNRGYTKKNGKKKGYYRWGKSGKKYHYDPGNERSRATAKGLARRQKRAIFASGGE